MKGNCHGCSKRNVRLIDFGTEKVCADCYFSDDLRDLDPEEKRIFNTIDNGLRVVACQGQIAACNNLLHQKYMKLPSDVVELIDLLKYENESVIQSILEGVKEK